MITKNCKAEGASMNGTRALIESFSLDSTGSVSHIPARSLDSGSEISISRMSIRVSDFHNPSGRLIKFNRTQFPCVPAWANTVHKSQGLILSAVAIIPEDFMKSSGFFLTYVATTRPTIIEELFIFGDLKRDHLDDHIPKAVAEEYQRIQSLERRTLTGVQTVQEEIDFFMR